MRNMYKTLFLILCTILLTSTAAMAFGEIRYADRPLNLRRTRSARAEWVGSLYPGQKVRVAFLKDGWVAVFEPYETRNTEKAAVGFSNAKYLKKKQTRVEPKSWGELVVTTRKLNVRAKPSTSGRKLATLSEGEKVRIDFPDDDWTRVFSPKATIRSQMGGIGYSSVKYFAPVTDDAPSAVSAPAPSPVQHTAPEPVSAAPVQTASSGSQVGGVVTPPPAKVQKKPYTPWGKVIEVQRAVKLHRERSLDSRLEQVLSPGQTVRVDFLKNGWYAVFDKDEPLRREFRAMGYALKGELEAVTTSDVPALASSKVTAAPSREEKTPKGETPDKSGQTTLVIDKSKFKAGKRPDPTPDKTAHGYKYRLLEKSETKRFGETWISLKVFLSTTKLPGLGALEDFSRTLWKEHRHAGKNVVVLIFLPGQDTEDLAYGVIKFNNEKLLETWVRKTTLFGTDFM